MGLLNENADFTRGFVFIRVNEQEYIDVDLLVGSVQGMEACLISFRTE